MMKRAIFTVICVIGVLTMYAAAPTGYYAGAQGKNKGALLAALEDIVGEHTTLGYGDLWDLFYESDVTSEGYIWDMYSTSKYTPGKNQCGNYTSIGDCYNREHSMPKSWFDDQSPMYSDAFHLYPTDGKVNGQRSNYPFGECANGSYVSSNGGVKALGRLGTSTFSGYSGTVFEPDDQYKGDFARSYFYMAAAYNSHIDEWNSAQLAGNSYPCFSAWSVNLLMKWHREDPVSQKETNRNEVVYKWQGNRNPFIDHPELAEYVWGTKTGEGWMPGGTSSDPIIINPDANETYDCGVVSKGRTTSINIPLQTTGITEELTVRVQNTNFSVTPDEVSVADAKVGISLTLTYSPKDTGVHTATLEIYNGEVGVEVSVKGECVNGIPAQDATDVTFEGFTAHWTDVDGGATYKFTLFEDDGTTVVAGYPVDVLSSEQKYTVTGLDYERVYYYRLSCDDRVSNMVKVTTASPHRILAFSNVPEGGLKFSAYPDMASAIQEMSIYTEYITEKINVSVTGEFELSMDNSNWSQSIGDIDPEGETFFVRMKAVAAEGSYQGVLSLSTSSMDGEELDLTGSVAAPRSFLEDFEEMSCSSYYTGTVQGTACTWKVGQMYLGTTAAQDYMHGTQCARIKKGGYIEMAEDKPNGIGTLSFYARPFSNDADAEVAVSYSSDGGVSWSVIASPVITIGNDGMTEYSYTVNTTGKVRVKFEVNTGKRLCIDDVAISDYVTASGVEQLETWQWMAYSVAGGIMIDTPMSMDVEIYSMEAVKVYGSQVSAGKTVVPLEKGVYIVLGEDKAKKVIVK
ncbi:MAG: endonuclease [Muribaculaceae bacterium]|nr:endonuclease [Muribaculaceae bacterium]